MSFDDAVAAYLADQDPRSLEQLRNAIQAAPGYSSSGASLADAAALLDAGRSSDALARLAAQRQANFLSPRGHLLFSRALDGQRLGELAELEKELAVIALDTLLASGDGQRSSPYLVLRITDEYDILASLGATHTKQGVVVEGSRVLDVFEAEDGESLWFELYRGGGGGDRVDQA